MKLVMEFVGPDNDEEVKECLEDIEAGVINTVRFANQNALWDGGQKLDEPRYVINMMTMWEEDG